MKTTFFKLDAPQDAAHRLRCLIELEHAAGLDAQLCWLQATIQARALLQRMPTTDELRPVTVKTARKLAKARRAMASDGLALQGRRFGTHREHKTNFYPGSLARGQKPQG